MNVLYSASTDTPCVLEVLFKRVHDDGSGKETKELICSRKGTLKVLSDTFSGIFLDGNDNFLEKLIPFIL
jgi:hypothetical protein